jgi:ketosteroid isomerase-like protein
VSEADRLGLVERLYDALDQRNEEEIAALCDERLEYVAIAGDVFGSRATHVGPAGLSGYLRELAEIWEVIQLTPSEVDCRGDRVLVRGRVYVRNHELGIRDMPVAWIWELRDGRFVSGEAFADPEEAVMRFAAVG